MKNITLFILILSVSLLAAPKNTTEFLENMQKTYDEMKSFCADFTQTFQWTLAEETQVIKGSICSKGHDKFKIDIPDQYIVTDGKTLWTLNKVNNQLLIDTPERKDNSNPLLQDFISKYLLNYDAVIDEATSDKSVTHLIMTAKTENFVNKVELWVDSKSYLIQKIIQYDLNENLTIYEINSLNTDVKLSNDEFTFSPPADIEIIDMR